MHLFPCPAGLVNNLECSCSRRSYIFLTYMDVMMTVNTLFLDKAIVPTPTIESKWTSTTTG